MVTKGHGLTVEFINNSCPSDLEPYRKAYDLEVKRMDEFNWILGCYVESAVLTAVEKNLAGRKSKSKYIEKPLLVENMEKQKANSGKLSKAEIKRQRELFAKQLSIFKVNYDLEHKKNEKEQNIPI